MRINLYEAGMEENCYYNKSIGNMANTFFPKNDTFYDENDTEVVSISYSVEIFYRNVFCRNPFY